MGNVPYCVKCTYHIDRARKALVQMCSGFRPEHLTVGTSVELGKYLPYGFGSYEPQGNESIAWMIAHYLDQEANGYVDVHGLPRSGSDEWIYMIWSITGGNIIPLGTAQAEKVRLSELSVRDRIREMANKNAPRPVDALPILT